MVWPATLFLFCFFFILWSRVSGEAYLCNWSCVAKNQLSIFFRWRSVTSNEHPHLSDRFSAECLTGPFGFHCVNLIWRTWCFALFLYESDTVMLGVTIILIHIHAPSALSWRQLYIGSAQNNFHFSFRSIFPVLWQGVLSKLFSTFEWTHRKIQSLCWIELDLFSLAHFESWTGKYFCRHCFSTSAARRFGFHQDVWSWT